MSIINYSDDSVCQFILFSTHKIYPRNFQRIIRINELWTMIKFYRIRICSSSLNVPSPRAGAPGVQFNIKPVTTVTSVTPMRQ